MMRPLLILIVCLVSQSRADELPTLETVVRRGVERITQAASDWPKHKTCFSCHHQTLPMLGVIEAGRAGHGIDKDWMGAQSRLTHAYFEERIDDMLAGEHVPGGATTTGYGLWALQLAQAPADATTTAMVAYVLKVQGVARLNGREPADLGKINNGRWMTSCRRLPMQGSDVADTVLSLLGLRHFATKEQQPAFEKARAAALKWLAQAKLQTQEDRIWRLWGLHHLEADEVAKNSVRNGILQTQQSDGGWGQVVGLASDGFSTGQTLFMLLKTGMPKEHPGVAQARDWLRRAQLDDGSWLVESTVKNKAQPYFENGDPHGEHQFLSTAATAWAVAGLAQLLPEKARE